MQLRKSHIIIGVIIIVTLVALGWFFSRPAGKVEFALAPQEATLRLNDTDQTINHKQVLTLAPGTYDLTFFRDGFSSEETTVVVVDGETTRLVMALQPQTEAAQKIIDDNSESVAVVKEYRSLQRTTLFDALPMSGVGYQIDTCPSIKQPNSDKTAICITVESDAGEQAGRLALTRLGYDLDDYEVLVGQDNLMTVYKKDTYKVETYNNDPSDKPKLYITPIGTPFVSPETPYHDQLEQIRSTSLAELEAAGYNPDNYVIFFSDSYLARYNEDIYHGPDHHDYTLEEKYYVE
ncbi:MAG TPA: carboxypeptidase-like regulatory domain-containing protein [Candidatus Saccharimonadales bacterium]|nr:carboxypeptidase-like regulatory domain-containing protein [Candidatus Saccharimonadales bacterium]